MLFDFHMQCLRKSQLKFYQFPYMEQPYPYNQVELNFEIVFHKNHKWKRLESFKIVSSQEKCLSFYIKQFVNNDYN